jgi:deoxycytidine triphosphate deaminase
MAVGNGCDVFFQKADCDRLGDLVQHGLRNHEVWLKRYRRYAEAGEESFGDKTYEEEIAVIDKEIEAMNRIKDTLARCGCIHKIDWAVDLG